ncbi:MAG: hypothetical protein IPI67_32615 [Myxococcales bacterium]|nr:hypothetical protein [Myxococcales bacterium]
MTETKDSKVLDTATIDDGWGADSEPPDVAVPAPGPAAKAEPAVAQAASSLPRSTPMVSSKPQPRLLSPVRQPPPVPPPARTGEAEAPPPEDDDIEFEADVVARDSMPTFQHPNPLEFDRDVDSEGQLRPLVPRPPRLPKIPKR